MLTKRSLSSSDSSPKLAPNSVVPASSPKPAPGAFAAMSRLYHESNRIGATLSPYTEQLVCVAYLLPLEEGDSLQNSRGLKK